MSLNSVVTGKDEKIAKLDVQIEKLINEQETRTFISKELRAFYKSFVKGNVKLRNSREKLEDGIIIQTQADDFQEGRSLKSKKLKERKLKSNGIKSTNFKKSKRKFHESNERILSDPVLQNKRLLAKTGEPTKISFQPAELVKNKDFIHIYEALFVSGPENDIPTIYQIDNKPVSIDDSIKAYDHGQGLNLDKYKFNTNLDEEDFYKKTFFYKAAEKRDIKLETFLSEFSDHYLLESQNNIKSDYLLYAVDYRDLDKLPKLEKVLSYETKYIKK